MVLRGKTKDWVRECMYLYGGGGCKANREARIEDLVGSD